MTEGKAVTAEHLVWSRPFWPEEHNLTFSQRSRWKPLTVSPDFFTNCKKHPINYIPAENYPRSFYFFDCKEIVFRDERGENVWSTMGAGEMEVPEGIAILINRGKLRNG
jgi:hypothetical protein